jgi:stage V sporulation protein D (sporulation-specific penicillin-binding protein)
MLKEWYVQKVDGLPASQAASKISVNGLSTLYGTLDMNSETIVARTYPDYYKTLYKTGVVVLYPENVSEEEMLTTRVPNMAGMSAIECIEACLKMNLNCKIDKDSDIKGVCISQSVPSGQTVKAGDIIYVKLSSTATVNYNQQNDATKSTTAVDTEGEDGVADNNKRRDN